MTEHDDVLNIATPENVAFAYKVAGIGSRFLACLLDTLALTGLILILSIGLLLILGQIEALQADGDVYAAWFLAMISLLVFVVNWGYFITFESLWNGQTPGKRVLHLRVIRTDGAPAGLGDIVIRNLIRVIDMLPAFYGVGLTAMFANSQARRLGDLAAGTLVVYDEAPTSTAGLMAALQALAQPTPSPAGPALFGGDDLLPLERLGENDRLAAEDFIRRRESLANRQHLADILAKAFYRRMNLSDHAPYGSDAERLLERIAAARRGS